MPRFSGLCGETRISGIMRNMQENADHIQFQSREKNRENVILRNYAEKYEKMRPPLPLIQARNSLNDIWHKKISKIYIENRADMESRGAGCASNQVSNRQPTNKANKQKTFTFKYRSRASFSLSSLEGSPMGPK